MPNMEELISRILGKISEGKEFEILATKLNFDYANGQIKMDENTKNLCVFAVTGGDFTDWPIYQQFFKNG